MSYNKEKILELIEKNRARYRATTSPHAAAFDLYRTQSNYEQLTYHNVDHVIDVVSLYDLLIKMDNLDRMNADMVSARTALIYHDVGHSGHPDNVEGEDGRDNIERAVTLASQHLLEQDPSTSDRQLYAICNYIRSTRYPAPSEDFNGIDTRVVDYMVDADILWGLLPGNAEQSMLGLWIEQVNSGATENKPCDIEALLTRQIKFIQTYQPATRAGRHFKQALFVQASEAWALVALEFLRQQELAQAVETMADEELLRLHSAIKRELPRPE